MTMDNKKKSIKLQKKRLESAEKGGLDLTKQMRGQERNGELKRKNKKKMRLGKRNARDRARLISQMPVDKKIRLKKRKVTLANETCELIYFF